ncbi:MAG: hypothetical protein QF629_03735 [Alphaproteobacteria bacterium]|nr:hypothetical protein [Alphaproteobacteria bacterium]MDP7173343.1 hypothetical protein [Alphaproteobacteria bacterium]MDP7234705.1 hypothetical protein [Alphaproteobacteria bacterium]MEE1544401.1 hypothetical protein [Alphaproteobacteria bacterium]HJN21398.1 hypothetical protein [Alphaproteobacteria bacterium]
MTFSAAPVSAEDILAPSDDYVVIAIRGDGAYTFANVEITENFQDGLGFLD